MAYTTINKSTAHHNTKLYTGNGGTNAITGVGFQPDLVMFAKRSSTSDKQVYDAVRGTTKVIWTNGTWAEATQSTGLTYFNSDGFTVGSNGDVNANSATYASWNWKANGAGSVDSSTGSISATVSANTTAGFSIIKFTNPSSGNFTIPHGLGVAPDMLFFKCTGGVQSWFVLHKNLSSFTDRYLRLQTNDSEITYTMQSQAPTSTLLYLNSGGVSNANTETICYAFASKTGYSKFGSYTGIDASDNAFVYCGFAPSFIMFKRKDSANSWGMFDNKRDALNPNTACLDAENTDAESSVGDVDFLSNGFKIRSASGLNGDGQYIYMAFGQSLVGSNNVPCTAR